MPFANIKILKGRTPEQIKELVQVVTEDMSRILKCSPDAIDILVEEHEKDHWAHGGKLYSE